MNAMARAWDIAREAVTRFGGTAKEYFDTGLCLKMAYAGQSVPKIMEITMDGKTKVKVNADVEATAKTWEGYGKKKIYFQLFSRVQGAGKKYDKLCFDVNLKGFTACANSYADSPSVDNSQWAAFRTEILTAFGLN